MSFVEVYDFTFLSDTIKFYHKWSDIMKQGIKILEKILK